VDFNKIEYLSDAEIHQLDQKIDEKLRSFSLLSLSWDDALLHLLLVFDDLIGNFGREDDLAKRRNGYRQAYRFLDHSARWVYQFCTRGQSQKTLLADFESLNAARELAADSWPYLDLWTQMSLLWRHRTQCRELEPCSYEFSPKSLDSHDRDVGRMLVAHADDPQDSNDARSLTATTRLYVQNKLRVKRIDTKLSYIVSPELFRFVMYALSDRSLLKWTMDAEWNLGGYTYAELRTFWASLQTIQMVHDIAFESMKVQSDRYSLAQRRKHLTSSILMMSRRGWVTELSFRSGLSFETTEIIFDDLIYDGRNQQQGKPKSHVMNQPFFKFGNGTIGLSNKIVQISNIERNVWNLISLLRPNIHDKLKNLKEDYWIGELQETAEKLGLKSIPRIRFSYEGKSRDIDLLLIDRYRKFGLVCELKWITATDDVKGVVSQDDQIEVGIEQASLSNKWLKANLKEISARYDIPLGELEKIDFRPLVISKDNLPSGFLAVLAVPVITENLFNWILSDPHQRDILTLWIVADSRSYLPKPGVHFRTISLPPIIWGDMKFILKNLTFETIKRWNPKVDILFPKKTGRKTIGPERSRVITQHR
jgi:hypothetical protein